MNPGKVEAFKEITHAYEILSRGEVQPIRYAKRGPTVAGSVYSQRYPSTSLPVAAWGIGLIAGCLLFGGAIIIGKSEMFSHNVVKNMSVRRTVEPSHNVAKREMIRQILLERAQAAKTTQKGQKVEENRSVEGGQCHIDDGHRT